MSCRGDLLIQVLNAAWHPDSSRGREGIKALIRAQTLYTLQPAAKHEATKHTYAESRHIVSTGSVRHHHASRSVLIEKFLLGIGSGFRVENLSTVWFESWRRSGSKLTKVRLTSWTQQILREWANYNIASQCIVSCLMVHISGKRKQQNQKNPATGIKLASPLAPSVPNPTVIVVLILEQF